MVTNIPQRYDGVFRISRECCEAIVHDAAHIIRVGDKALIPGEDIKKKHENPKPDILDPVISRLFMQHAKYIQYIHETMRN